MRNGSLFDAVVKGKKSVSYHKRIAIALDIASGLSFLHKKGYEVADSLVLIFKLSVFR